MAVWVNLLCDEMGALFDGKSAKRLLWAQSRPRRRAYERAPLAMRLLCHLAVSSCWAVGGVVEALMSYSLSASWRRRQPGAIVRGSTSSTVTEPSRNPPSSTTASAARL